MRKNKSKTIFLAGLLAGTLDIATACIDYYIRRGKGPENVLRYVASGVFGNNAFTSGSIMMWWGLLFHYIIAFSLTIFFFLIYPRIKILRINVLLTAVIIGIFSWAITTLVIVPLSNTPKSPFNTANAIKNAVILIFTIGLPVSIMMKWFYKKR